MFITIGMTLFTGQFLFLFFAYQAGIPPGVASVTQQIQVFFTVLLAAIIFGEIPSVRQSIGMIVAFSGLILIGSTIGGDLTLSGLLLALAAAFSWAVGNVLVKKTEDVPMLPLMMWLSFIPPIPALIWSALDPTSTSIYTAIIEASWQSLVALGYLAVFATAIAFAIWGDLLSRYPAAAIAPFALLAPCTGSISSAIVFNELFSPARYVGMALIFAGLAVALLQQKSGAPVNVSVKPNKANDKNG
jgi:O-acetylserine/cysteine efflux transporter